jgi:hypothetical protein
MHGAARQPEAAAPGVIDGRDLAARVQVRVVELYS